MHYLVSLVGVVVWCSAATVRAEAMCAEHLTCQSPDLNSDHLQFLKMNSSVPTWYELCNCDQHCHLFGDCCADSPVLDDIRLDEWSFVKVRLSSKITFMSLMKNKCAPKWNETDSDVQTRCEHTSLSPLYSYLLPDVEHYLLYDAEDEFNNWHVTGRNSLVTYRNIYCAMCNGDIEVDAWSQRLKCHSPSEQDQTSLEQAKATPSGAKCTTVLYQFSPEIIGKKKLTRLPLQNKVFASCNLGWYKMHVGKQQDYVFETVKKCLIYYEPVVVHEAKSKRFIVFKNKHCAICNDYQASTHRCPSAAVDQLTQVPASFTQHLVSGYDTNYVLGSAIADTGKRCHPGQLYNPLMESCAEAKSRSVPKPKGPPDTLGHPSRVRTTSAASGSTQNASFMLKFVLLPLLSLYFYIQ